MAALGCEQNLPLHALRTFVAVVDCGSFTAAANRLGLTQPSVSQQIRKLEEILGEPLLERNTRGGRVTDSGASLLDFARRIVNLNDEAIIALTRPQVVGALRLGLPHEFTFSLLPRLVGSFAQIHPGVVVEVECELSKNLVNRIDEFDIVLALHRQQDGEGGMVLREEPLCWACSPDYRPDRDEALLVAAAPAPCIYRQVLQQKLNGFSAGWSLYLTTTSYGAICGAVSSGTGVTLLARSVVPDNLIATAIPGVPSLETLELRMHKREPVDPAVVETFESFVIDRVAEKNARPTRGAM